MKRGLSFALITGCAVILLLQMPQALSTVSAGWRGPYAGTPSPEATPVPLSQTVQAATIGSGLTMRYGLEENLETPADIR